MHEPLDWIGSDGPIIVIPQAFADSWYGMHRPVEEDEEVDEAEIVEMADGQLAVVCDEVDTDDPASHYDEACAALDGVPGALVEVGEFVAVALQTAGHQVCWWPLPDGGVVVKIVFAESEAAAEQALSDVPFDDLDWEPVDEWELEEPDAYLLPATDTLEDVQEETLSLDLAAATYDLSCARWDPDESISLQLFRFSRE